MMINYSTILLAFATAVSLASAHPVESRAESASTDEPIIFAIDYFCDQKCIDRGLGNLVVTQTIPGSQTLAGTTMYDFLPKGDPPKEYNKVGEIKFESRKDKHKHFYVDRAVDDETKKEGKGREVHWDCFAWPADTEPYMSKGEPGATINVGDIKESIDAIHVTNMVYKCNYAPLPK